MNEENILNTSENLSTDQMEKFWTEVSKKLGQNIIHNSKSEIVKDISGCQKNILGVLIPNTETDLCEVVNIIKKFKIPFHIVSTGRNWGMGAGLPISDNCLLIRLHLLNQIISFNEELGVIKIQPGVTQKQISDFLSQKKSKFYLDVTGSHELTSVIGNCLERGVAYNSQRTKQVIQLKVLLMNGQLITTGFNANNSSDKKLNNIYSFGVGPDLKGLFFQSNFGIVTEMTFKLNLKKNNLSFLIKLKNEEAYLKIMDLVPELINKEILSGIPHSFNQFRFCSALEPLIYQEILKSKKNISNHNSNNLTESPISKNLLQLTKSISKKYASDSWYLVGKIEGENLILNAKKKLLKKYIKKHFLNSISEISIQFNYSWLQKIPVFLLPTKLRYFILASLKISGLSKGVPSDGTVHSVYWPTDENLIRIPSQALNFLDDPQSFDMWKGRIFYLAPLVPFQVSELNKIINLLEQFSKENNIKVATAFNVLSSDLLEGVLSIHFSNTQSEHFERLNINLNNLLIQNGFYPYRLSNSTMDSVKKITDKDSLKLMTQIKNSIDPFHLLSPGKYIPIDTKY